MKKVNLIIFLVIISLSAFCQNAKQYFKAGEEFIESKKYEDAIEQFTQTINLDPDYIKAYLQRALAYEKLDQLKEAAQDYERAITFQTKKADLYFHAARLNYAIKEFTKALEYVNTAIDKKRKYIDAIDLKVKILIGLEDYSNAHTAAQEALKYNDNAANHFYLGLISEKTDKLTSAESEYEKAIKLNNKYIEAYLHLARIRLQLDKPEQALAHCNAVIGIDKNNREAYKIRSKIYVKKLDYPNAINDISRNLLLNSDDLEMYMLRGQYYQDFAQHQNAINDFNKVLILDKENSEAYYKRAFSYEQIANFSAAIKDYEKLLELSEYDGTAKKLLESAKDRLYELMKESNKPQVVLVDPVPYDESTIKLPKNKEELAIKGKIIDESDIKSLKVNNVTVPFMKNNDSFEFLANVDISDMDNFTVTAVDVYDNMLDKTFSIKRTEIDPPRVSIIAPYASDNGEIFLDSNDPTIYIEGKIADESPLKTILIDGVSASFKVDELNPKFSASLNIANKAKFTVTATDIYGNEANQVFLLNREGASLLENNPMGKTWIVFIENSDYNNFPSLDGPAKDVSTMRQALAKYDIHKIIHKKNLTKSAMERFFSIELRDLVKSNRVNSLLLWYAGHGKFINEIGYWIPIDAKRDDEFTYFNINALRASLQSYTNVVTHTLIVTDACESGPTFFHAMRNAPEIKNCNDTDATQFKSSQVISSAGYELAVDNSQFTRTFASSLEHNANSCIPIESIFIKIKQTVNSSNSKQNPKFGTIEGLEHENGTFFFIAK